MIPFLDLFWDVIKQFSSIQLNKIEKDNKIFYIASATPKEEDKNEKMREKPIDHVKGRMKFLLKSFDFNSQFYTFLARNQNNSALQGREFNKSTMDFLKTFVEQQQNSA